MGKKFYNVHLGAYYTADMAVEAESKEEALNAAYASNDAFWEYADDSDPDVWEIDEQEYKTTREYNERTFTGHMYAVVHRHREELHGGDTRMGILGVFERFQKAMEFADARIAELQAKWEDFGRLESGMGIRTIRSTYNDDFDSISVEEVKADKSF